MRTRSRHVTIPRIAIKRFLDRPRKDWRVYKKFTDNEILSSMRKLPTRPPVWKKLNRVQRICLIIGAKTKRFCFWNDMGTGKTLLATALARYFIKRREMTRGLVLLPNKINKSSFAKDVKKLSPKTTTLILRGSSQAKWEQLETTRTHLVIETYAGLVRMISKEAKSKKAKKMRLKLNKSLFNRLRRHIDGLFMDESIMVIKKKRHGSLMHRLCAKLAENMPVVFALNGTPFGRDPVDMWGQMFIVDRGETLGETLGLFRAVFYTAKKNYWGGYTYKFDRHKNKLLHTIIANRSIRFKAKEGDLPDVKEKIIHVSLPKDAQEYFDKAKADLTVAHGSYEEMKNAFMRMRQLSSGWIGYKDDETGTRAQYGFEPYFKRDRLIRLIEKKKDRGKIIVFHEFIFSGSQICYELEQRKIGFVRLDGRTKDPDEVLDRFDNDKKCRVFVLMNSSGAFNLNLQVAKYGMVYESPVSLVTRKQIERRFIRQHSPHDWVVLYDFVTRGTYDQRILDAHAQGRSLFDVIVEDRKRKRDTGVSDRVRLK